MIQNMYEHKHKQLGVSGIHLSKLPKEENSNIEMEWRYPGEHFNFKTFSFLNSDIRISIIVSIKESYEGCTIALES